MCLARKFYAEPAGKLPAQRKGRVCYRWSTFPDTQREAHKRGAQVPVPVFTETGEPAMDTKRQALFRLEWLDADDFVATLAQIKRQRPEVSLFEIHNLFFPQVCPTALADPVVDALVRLESSCAEYKHDIVDDELRAQLLGFVMPLADVLEAFDVIRGTKAEFQRHEIEARTAQRGSPSAPGKDKGKK